MVPQSGCMKAAALIANFREVSSPSKGVYATEYEDYFRKNVAENASGEELAQAPNPRPINTSVGSRRSGQRRVFTKREDFSRRRRSPAGAAFGGYGGEYASPAANPRSNSFAATHYGAKMSLNPRPVTMSKPKPVLEPSEGTETAKWSSAKQTAIAGKLRKMLQAGDLLGDIVVSPPDKREPRIGGTPAE